MKFLIPIDFSSDARNASEYAAHLAQASGSALSFLHVINPVINDNLMLTEEFENMKKEIQRELLAWHQAIQHRYNIPCSGTTVIGKIKEEIIKASQDQAADFIIMGTRGASGIQKLFFGSNAASVIEESERPVLAIPEDVTFTPPKRIVYATDYQNSDLDALRQLTVLAKPFQSAINVVHIIREEERSGTELSVIDYFSDLVKKNIVYPNITCEVYRHDNPMKGIEGFAKKKKADFLVLATQKRTALQRVFDKSITKEIAYHTRIPLLSFHVH